MNYIPMVFLHQNSSVHLLVIYRSVSISLRTLAVLTCPSRKVCGEDEKKGGNLVPLEVHEENYIHQPGIY